jgi:hypothetical protein
MRSYKRRLLGLAAAAGACSVLHTAWAHHSLASEFNVESNLELRGTLTNLEWYNPHIWLYLDVVNTGGKTGKWQCEMGSPNQLKRIGWEKEKLPAGTLVRVLANQARDGSNTCSIRNIMLDDGTLIYSRRT